MWLTKKTINAQPKRKYLYILFSKGPRIILIQDMLMKYLFHTSNPLIKDQRPNAPNGADGSLGPNLLRPEPSSTGVPFPRKMLPPPQGCQAIGRRALIRRALLLGPEELKEAVGHAR